MTTARRGNRPPGGSLQNLSAWAKMLAAPRANAGDDRRRGDSLRVVLNLRKKFIGGSTD
jgi:hypothetical protein